MLLLPGAGDPDARPLGLAEVVAQAPVPRLQIQFKEVLVRLELLIGGEKARAPLDKDAAAIRAEPSGVHADPARILAPAFPWGDGPARGVDQEHLGRDIGPALHVPQVANQDDLIAHQGCRGVIRRWKEVAGVAVDLQVVASADDDVVVDEEIGVVEVLMDAPNPDLAAVGKRQLVVPPAIAAEAGPIGVGIGAIEEVIEGVGLGLGFQGPLPDGIGQALRVGLAAAGSTPVQKVGAIRDLHGAGADAQQPPRGWMGWR